VTRLYDIDGAERRALDAIADFRGKRVLEVGCGDGRLTWGYAPEAASVLAIDTDEEAITTARREQPRELSDRVEVRVESAVELDEPPASFDTAFFSWSL
jgi:2-polyprenyl-3-methyl-5-hydroxy-6-metoxy-1,4-benzoquinol methylase